MLGLTLRLLGVVICLLGSVGLAIAQALDGAAANATALSEADFLTEMPVVLSVSRLPQRLDETPGAVTIIDRDMIRLSGARDVADLLRLVPGFQTSTSFETGAPLASYHGGFDAYSVRMQVLVDGRSVYSPYLFGGTATGLQSVAMADIERIEVLRGSNSAAYGARAMLGVINIVTRHTVDTLGGRTTLSGGENGVRDAQASMGWGQNDATFRLGLDRRGDDGLSGANGHNLIQRVNVRADLRANTRDEIELRAGGLSIDSGEGYAGRSDNPPHDRAYASGYAQLDWRRSLGADEDLALSFSHTQETIRDSFAYSLLDYKNQVAAVPDGGNGALIQFKNLVAGIDDSLDINTGGHADSSALSVQHTLRHNAALRVVLGGELRHESVVSRALYKTDAALVTDFTRLFGNAEWRFADHALLNAGGMYEKNSISGDNFAPRVMVNWHVAPGQTLRFGVSKAHRSNSTYEQFSDVRYTSNGVLLKVTALAKGNIQPEELLVREMGYLGDFPRLRTSLDVRVFHERIAGLVRGSKYLLPAGTTLLPSAPWDYVNDEDFTIKGLEYQLKWRPWRDAQFIFNQTYTSVNSIDTGTVLPAAKVASFLTYLQKLPGGVDLSLMHQDSGPVVLTGSSGSHPAMTRTDLRLALPVQFGATRGEVALVVQNLGSPYLDFDQLFKFERRAFVTLRLEN